VEPPSDPSHWISHGSALLLAFSTLLDMRRHWLTSRKHIRATTACFRSSVSVFRDDHSSIALHITSSSSSLLTANCYEEQDREQDGLDQTGATLDIGSTSCNSILLTADSVREGEGQTR